jgi:hypothetical protein
VCGRFLKDKKSGELSQFKTRAEGGLKKFERVFWCHVYEMSRAVSAIDVMAVY